MNVFKAFNNQTVLIILSFVYCVVCSDFVYFNQNDNDEGGINTVAFSFS